MSRYNTKSKGAPPFKDYEIPIKIGGGRPKKTMQDMMNWYNKGPNPAIDRYRIHKTQQPQKYGISRIPSYTNNNNCNPLEKSYSNPTEKLYKSNNSMAGKHRHLNNEPAAIYDCSQQLQSSALEKLIRNLREKDQSSIYENKLTKEELTEKQSANAEHNKDKTETKEEAETKETFESTLEKIRRNLDDDTLEQNESILEKQSHDKHTKEDRQKAKQLQLQSIPLEKEEDKLEQIARQAKELNFETRAELQDTTTDDATESKLEQQKELIINETSNRLKSLPTELFENNPDQTEFRKRNQDYDSMEYTRGGGKNYY